MELQPLITTNIFRLSHVLSAQSNVNKIALPVDNRLLLYARFKHVHGVPSFRKGEGLPLASLKALDNLIDRLLSVKGKNGYWPTVSSMNTEDLNFALDRMQSALHRELQSDRHPVGLLGHEQNDMGLLFEIVA